MRSGWATVFALVLVVSAIVHVAWAGLWLTSRPDAAEAATFQQHARTSLPPLLAGVPVDASLLVVTGSLEPVPFDFYLLPRSVRLLAAVAPLRLAAAEAERLDPDNLDLAKQVQLVEERCRRLAAAGQVWSLSAAERELADADYVLAFALADVVLEPFKSRLRPLGTNGYAVLYGVEPAK